MFISFWCSSSHALASLRGTNGCRDIAQTKMKLSEVWQLVCSVATPANQIYETAVGKHLDEEKQWGHIYIDVRASLQAVGLQKNIHCFCCGGSWKNRYIEQVNRTKEAKYPQIYILHSLFPFLPVYLLPLYLSPVPSQNICFILCILLKANLEPPASPVSAISVFMSPVYLHCNGPSPLPCVIDTYFDPSLGSWTSSVESCPELNVQLTAFQKNEQTSLSLCFPFPMHE